MFDQSTKHGMSDQLDPEQVDQFPLESARGEGDGRETCQLWMFRVEGDAEFDAAVRSSGEEQVDDP